MSSACLQNQRQRKRSRALMHSGRVLEVFRSEVAPCEPDVYAEDLRVPKQKEHPAYTTTV